VLEAALSVFCEKGFRGATIRDITLVAGVADGTIYNLFENKAALRRALLEARPGDPPPAHTIDAHSGTPLTPADVRTLLAARWKALDHNSRGMLRVVLAEALVDPEFRRLYRDTVMTPAITCMTAPLAVATGAQTHELDARIVTGLFMGLAMLRLLGDDVIEAHAEQVPDRLTALLTYGLIPPSAEPVQ
jgi:AcrR family transcriptional regulator